MVHLQFWRFMGSASGINAFAYFGDYGGSPALYSHALRNREKCFL